MLPMKKNSPYLVVKCSKLLQDVRSEVFRRVRAAVVNRQVEGVTRCYFPVAIGRHRAE